MVQYQDNKVIRKAAMKKIMVNVKFQKNVLKCLYSCTTHKSSCQKTYPSHCSIVLLDLLTL